LKPAFVIIAVFAFTSAHAQVQPRHAGYEPLSAFVGSWTISGQESTYLETCGWYHGERHIICNTTLKRTDGSTGNSMSILSFIPDQGYVYAGIGSRGRYETHERGTFKDGLLEYIDRANGESTRIRIGPFSDRQVIPFVVHTSKNGTDWDLAESFNYIRVK
jgi:hypothetical protein